jgi:light-regulated signal transduction histidine kinase (bacteriophytochrome)
MESQRLERLLEEERRARREAEAIAERALVAVHALDAELKRADRELEEFAYIASHDLSEPLRMITSYLQLIERRYTDRLDADGREFIAFAVDGGQRLQRLIGGLLEYSRAGRAPLTAEAVDTNALMEQLLADLAGRLADTGGRVDFEGLPTVPGDPGLLARVFANLVGNGLKFARAGSPPTVRVTAQREGAGWRFRVADNGIGVPADQAERIFRIFQRLHARDEYEGTGVGLPICRRILERHGGWIELEPTPEGADGASFAFWLPDELPVSPRAAAAAPAA